MRCVPGILALIAVFLPGFGHPTIPASAAEPLALIGGTIIDVSNFGKSESDVKDSIIIIQHGKITAAGSRGKTKVPANAKYSALSPVPFSLSSSFFSRLYTSVIDTK